MNEIRSFFYDLGFSNVSEVDLIKRYNKHNQDVIETFEGTGNLLVINWTKSSG
tara:strand:+ start:404 stop:562 length:159 start_codon:yes stop_codon:yes gene_type:complete